MELLIDKYITTARLKPYLKRTDNNLKKALDLYGLNLEYSCQLYKLLSILETSLRNLINERCKKLFGYDWIINIKYDIHPDIMNRILNTTTATEKTRAEFEKISFIQESIVKDAIDKLKDDKKPITNDYLVANLVFGFWTRLFNKTYEGVLWNKSLSTIFNKKLSRNNAEDLLNEFRWLRNKIAHNGCVIDMKYSPQKYYNKILNFLEIIDPKLSNLAKKWINTDLFE